MKSLNTFRPLPSKSRTSQTGRSPKLLRLAKIDTWDIPKDDHGTPLRKAAYAAAPESESNSESEEEQDINVDHEDVVQPQPDDESDAVSVDSEQVSFKSHSNRVSSDEEDNIPLAQLARKYRGKRENSSSEDGIPLWKLSKRLKSRSDPEAMPSSEYDNDGGGSLMDITECRKPIVKLENQEKTNQIM